MSRFAALPVLVLSLAGCERTCEEGFVAWEGNCYATPAAAAAGGAAEPTDDTLDIDEFVDAFVAAYCAAWSTCNTSGDACPLEGGASTTTGCDYDPGAAQACVEGEFSCDDSFGEGLEMVMVPEACSDVCGSYR